MTPNGKSHYGSIHDVTPRAFTFFMEDEYHDSRRGRASTRVVESQLW